MFVSPEALEEFTGKERPSAQARFLRARFPNIVLTIRDDGTIALRQDEFDRYTLTTGNRPKARRKASRFVGARKVG